MNYMNLKGDTGPLVYPAGFLYIFSILRWLTDDGVNIFKGQLIFAIFYLLNLFLVLRIYESPNQLLSKNKSKSIDQSSQLISSNSLLKTLLNPSVLIPRWSFLFLIFSKRIHSIFMLRMFNDCIAVMLGFVGIHCFLQDRWRIGSVFYSLSVSVKMNMLLMAPGILIIFLVYQGLKETIFLLSICAVIQVLLGLPFLLTFPVQYLKRSFDVGRVFTYKWTVNLKFLSEEFFVSKSLSIILLLLTLIGMISFAIKWNRKIQQSLALSKLEKITPPSAHSQAGPLATNPHFIILTIFFSNFIGIVFSRTLHYQFYCWYYFTLPYLFLHALGFTTLTKKKEQSRKEEGWMGWVSFLVRLGVMFLGMGLIEVAFNIFPATWWSSLILQFVHIFLLALLFLAPVPCPFGLDLEKKAL